MIKNKKIIILWSSLCLIISFIISFNFYIYYDKVDLTPLVNNFENNHVEFEEFEADNVSNLNNLSISQTLARPLFNSSRRQFVSMSEVEQKPPLDSTPISEMKPSIDEPKIKLQGVLLFNGHLRALIEIEGSPESRWLKVGDKIGEWQIQNINENKLVINYLDKDIYYYLYNTKD